MKTLFFTTIGSQSLLIQRSYSYKTRYIKWIAIMLIAIPSYSEVLFLQERMNGLVLIFLIAIPSYSEVLFLHEIYQVDCDYVISIAIPSYSEVLFLQKRIKRKNWSKINRNPFLFRGPIPTVIVANIVTGVGIAIPSYSEVLFLPRAFITPLFST